MWCWSSIKGICLAFLLDYFGHKCVCEFFSMSTGEQEEVVVVVVVVVVRGGGLWVISLPPYTRCKFRSLLPVSRLSQLVFVFFGGGGGGGGVRVPGLVGWEKTIESSRSFHYSQAFTHISKYENIDSNTDSVFTLDSAFNFSRNVTKPELVWVFSQIHYLDSRTRFDLNCFREFSENIQRRARKVIFIEGGWAISKSRGGSRIFFRRACTRLLLYFNTNKPHSFFFFAEYQLY